MMFFLYDVGTDWKQLCQKAAKHLRLIIPAAPARSEFKVTGLEL